MGCASSAEDAASLRAIRRHHVSPDAKRAIRRLDSDPLHAPATWAAAGAGVRAAEAIMYDAADDLRSSHSRGALAVEPSRAELTSRCAKLRAAAYFDHGAIADADVFDSVDHPSAHRRSPTPFSRACSPVPTATTAITNTSGAPEGTSLPHATIAQWIEDVHAAAHGADSRSSDTVSISVATPRAICRASSPVLGSPVGSAVFYIPGQPPSSHSSGRSLHWRSSAGSCGAPYIINTHDAGALSPPLSACDSGRAAMRLTANALSKLPSRSAGW